MKARRESEFQSDGTNSLKGKHGDQMSSMLDTRGDKQQSFMQTMMNTLESNKKRYDRQLYADWLTKVYDHCAVQCIKNDAGAPHTISELREIEK